jgi:hypothetical protein
MADMLVQIHSYRQIYQYQQIFRLGENVSVSAGPILVQPPVQCTHTVGWPSVYFTLLFFVEFLEVSL